MTEKKSFTNDDYQILNREILYQSIFRLVRYTIKHRLFNGEMSDSFTREVLERPSAAAIIPYDPYSNRVILIEQFRPGPLSHSKNPWLIEIPAGIFAENETPEALATREAH
jgi:ADP-ribose pyrophosphatase